MPTILVADDNSNIQKMVSLVFQEKGIRVVAVGNGEAACRKVPEVRPDLVLADVFMPVRNGYEVCEFVKQDPEFAETPVILLVGAFDPLDEKEARRVGANGVLKKPFVPPEPLVEMVSSLLGKSEPPVGEVAAVPAPPVVEPPPTPVFVRTPMPVYEEEESSEIAPTFGEPVATPAAKTLEVEEEDEAEPASEWARRRASVDYEIDTADSAEMVERLAAQKTDDEEPEILTAKKHLPFGGANVPEMVPSASSKPSSPWPDFTSPETIAPETAVAAQEVVSEQASVTSYETPLPEQELALPAPPVEEAPLPTTDVALAQEPSDTWGAPVLEVPPVTPEDNATREAAPADWALSQVSQEHGADSAEPFTVQSEEPKEFKPASAVPENSPVWQTAEENSPELAPQAAESSNGGAHPKTEIESSKDAAGSPFSQATIDDVVAKVISKLEPQLHEVLANGVLRPLVEELLNQQRDKK